MLLGIGFWIFVAIRAFHYRDKWAKIIAGMIMAFWQ